MGIVFKCAQRISAAGNAEHRQVAHLKSFTGSMLSARQIVIFYAILKELITLKNTHFDYSSM